MAVLGARAAVGVVRKARGLERVFADAAAIVACRHRSGSSVHVPLLHC